MSAGAATLEFVLSFDTHSALQAALETDLARGRALIPERRPIRERQRCQLTLVHPAGASFYRIEAEAVWSHPDGIGIGLEFIDWNEERANSLRRFVERSSPSSGQEALASSEDGSPHTSLDRDAATGSEPELRRTTLYDRIRRLKHHEQQQLARAGGHAERLALERCFGGAVWEALLQNPQLSGPEVANIAKKGSLPRPALAQIVANGGWIGIPEVQRALLGNPRLDPSAVTKILRLLPRTELAKVPQQARYTSRIRAEAKRLLNRFA